jgi:dTDP-4-dehydrorhamnose reductase
MAMRWLITGAAGMVGSDVRTALKAEGEDAIAVGRGELNITDPAAVHDLVDAVRPSVIVNCAAFTRVDDCESSEAEATAINGDGVAILAAEANRHAALLVHLSTDFVFDGNSRAPYEVDAPTAPLSAYGRGKLTGESAAVKAERHLILRTSWLFGLHGWNFVEAILKQVHGGNRELRVVNDQRGRPTYTPHLAAAILRLSRKAIRDEEARGIFHYADSPQCTWFDFASEIVAQLRLTEESLPEIVVHPVSSDAFPRPARRPSYSVLSTGRYERVTGMKPESWEEGLSEYLRLRNGG